MEQLLRFNQIQLPAFIEANPWLLFLVGLWVLVWTGIALWRSARLGHRYWFIAMLILQTIGILEIIYILFFSKRTEPVGGSQPQRPAQAA